MKVNDLFLNRDNPSFSLYLRTLATTLIASDCPPQDGERSTAVISLNVFVLGEQTQLIDANKLRNVCR